jgi:hypothetical protein
MLLLKLALESVERALALLEAAGPGPEPHHLPWLNARSHLAGARRDILWLVERATPEASC